MLIKCGKFRLKILIPFIYPISVQLYSLLMNKIIELNLFALLLTLSLSYILGGLFYIILKLRTNKKEINNIINSDNIIDLRTLSNVDKKDEVNEKNQIYIQSKRIKKKKEFKKYRFMLFLGLIYIIGIVAENFLGGLYDKPFHENLGILLEIISYIIYSKIFLGHKLYEHQILSLSIISIVLIGLFIEILLTKYDESFLNFCILLVKKISLCSIFSLDNVLGKYYLDNYMDTPYRLMLFMGLELLILVLIFEPFTFLIKSSTDPSGHIPDIILFFKRNIMNDYLFFMYYIFFIISTFLWSIGIWLTIYYLSPNHFITSDTFSEFISTLVLIIQGGDYYNNISYYISYPIIIFNSMIYNEMITINIWKFSKNTQEAISKREKEEYNSTDEISMCTEIIDESKIEMINTPSENLSYLA